MRNGKNNYLPSAPTHHTTNTQENNMALPKVLYIHIDKDGDEEFYIANEDADAQMEGVVGVYRLEEKLHVRHKLQLRKEGTKTWFDSSKG